MYNMMSFADRADWNQFFNVFERSMFPVEYKQEATFRTDIRELEDRYLLEAELPGFRKDNINVELNEGVLTISAAYDQENEERDEKNSYLRRERRRKSYRRSFRVSGIEEDEISAAYEDGVLKLLLPKQRKSEPQIRKISIQ